MLFCFWLAESIFNSDIFLDFFLIISRFIHDIRQCTQYFDYCYICLYTVVSRWSTLYNIPVYTFRTLAEAVKWLSLYKLKYRHGWKSCLIKNIGKNYLNERHHILVHIKLESVVGNIVILVTESSWRYSSHANFAMLVIKFRCWWHLLTIRHLCKKIVDVGNQNGLKQGTLKLDSFRLSWKSFFTSYKSIQHETFQLLELSNNVKKLSAEFLDLCVRYVPVPVMSIPATVSLIIYLSTPITVGVRWSVCYCLFMYSWE